VNNDHRRAAADADALAGSLARVAHAARSNWRRHVRRRWHDVRPAVLLALGISVLVLGTIGFEQYKVVHYGFLDSLYRAITLFAFGGAVAPPVPPTLQIARVVAPVLTGYAAVGTILALSREQARVLGIRLFVRRHVIVAGLGASGSRLALSLVDHEPVVAIEMESANAHLPTARVRGVRTLVGEATDELQLRRAGIDHARALVISCGRDGTNVDVAAAAAARLHRRRNPLTIFVHLSDLDLWRSFAVEGATFGPGGRGLRLEYFNVMATGAQLLLERDAPFDPTPREDGRALTPHVLIVGLEEVGEQLVLQIARMWGNQAQSPGDQLRITLAGPTAQADLELLRERYPSLEAYGTLGARQGAIESASFQAGAAMLGNDGRCDITKAFVCIADEGDALIAALALHARSDSAAVPVTVALPDENAGVGIMLASEHGRFGRIEPFGVLSRATSAQLLLRGSNELFARAQHAQWLRAQQANGITIADKPTMRRWEELDESQREVNRSFADDIQRKLDLANCMLVPMPLRDLAATPFSFTLEELELLAQEEHVRWVDDKLANGWRYGPKRDDSKKIHDQIKPWVELDEENQRWDRDAVRELPQTLELAGFRIQRYDAPPASA
jgi:hypothetical protein